MGHGGTPRVKGGTGQKPKPKPTRKMSGAVFAAITLGPLAVLLLIPVAIVLYGIASWWMLPASSAPVGHGYVIGVKGGTTLEGLPAAATREAFDAYAKADVAKDSYGIKELIHKGDVFVVAPGTKVLPIEYGFTVKGVRVLEGKHEGRMAWTYAEYVIPR